MKPEYVTVAVVGAGYWGPNLVRNFATFPECRIAWVCDTRLGRQRYIAERFPGIPVTADYETVLRDPAVDAVVLATPISTHYALAAPALEAGKHIFVEKPLAETSEQAGALVELARRKRRLLFAGHVFVYHPAIAAMKAAVGRRDIGKPCYVESSRVNLGPPDPKVDVIWDLAVHDISILLYLRGCEPTEVVAHGHRFLHPSHLDVAFLRVIFPDGFFAQHHVSWLSPRKVRRFSVYGSRGSLIFDDTATENKLELTDQGVDTRLNLDDQEVRELSYRPGTIVVPHLPAEEPLHAECGDFLACILNGGSPKSDGYAGLAVVRVLEAAQHSIKEGSRPVSLKMTKLLAGPHPAPEL